MARGVPSAADKELIERLAALGVRVSAAQLERWRGARLLPAHARRWLGRGRGSVSVLAEETVAVAAALGRHARPGRDLRWAVIAWYAEAGRPALPSELPVPEPPWPTVREALMWAMSRSSAQRLMVAARAAVTAARPRRTPSTPRPGGSWDTVRLTTRSAGDAAGARGPGRRARPQQGAPIAARGSALIAAAGMGAGEVGGEALVDALAVLTPGIDWSDVAAEARQAEENGEFDSWIQVGSVEPLGRLEAAGAQDMATARHAAQILAGVGGLYLMHGFGMPDTPGLARMRTGLEESGFALFVAQMVPLMINPSGVVHALSMCLAPEFAALAAWLESVLTEQANSSGGLLRLPGAEQDGAEAFMQAWISQLHDRADHARARRTGGAEASGA
nr:hypothetical protein [Streptomyces sp. S1D4-11]